MNYYPFHIGDYMVHTRHLSLMEDLAYRRLLDLYYTRNGDFVSLLPAEIARLVGMREQITEISTVLEEFFPEGKNKRADEELEKFRSMAEGGKRGAAKRWASPGYSPPIAPLSPPQSPPISNQEPRTKNQEPKRDTARKRATSLPEGFEISDRVHAWATSRGWDFSTDVMPNVEAFVSYVKRKGAKYVDWDEALMTAIREDWAKARAPKPGGTVPFNPANLYVPPPPLTPEERQRADAVRETVMAAFRTKAA